MWREFQAGHFTHVERNSKLLENIIEKILEAMILVKETTKKNITLSKDMNLDGLHQEEHLILGIKIVSLVTVSQATGFDRR